MKQEKKTVFRSKNCGDWWWRTEYVIKKTKKSGWISCVKNGYSWWENNKFCYCLFGDCKSCEMCKTSFSIFSERRLGFKISVVCDKCTPKYIPSCDFIKHSYEINRRFILAMRVIGVGYKGAKPFCGLMDFPPFLRKSTYCMILDHICEATRVRQESAASQVSARCWLVV